MKLLLALLMFGLIFSSHSSFAGDSDTAIGDEEIAQTMKNMNDLMAEARAPKMENGQMVGFDSPKGLDAKALEKLNDQRNLDILSHLEGDSESDSNTSD